MELSTRFSEEIPRRRGPRRGRGSSRRPAPAATTLTLFSNLGNPDIRLLPEKQTSLNVYDPVTGQVVEKTFTRPARELRTFSVAVSTREMEEPRWIRCADWNNLSRLFQKGDRVRLTGYFQLRTFEKDGETRRVRQFVVQAASIERPKIPHDLAA